MADQTSASIDLAARPYEIMAVIADFEHYPDWVDSMKSAEVLSFVDGKAKTVRMALDHAAEERLCFGVQVEATGRQLDAPRGKSAQGHGGLIPVEGQWRQNNGEVHLDR